MSSAFVLAISTGVVVIAVAGAIVLVVLIVAVSMRVDKSVARSGAVRLGRSATATLRARAKKTSAQTGRYMARLSAKTASRGSGPRGQMRWGQAPDRYDRGPACPGIP
jgi:hypothetical protein